MLPHFVVLKNQIFLQNLAYTACRFDGAEGELEVRSIPCFCASCLSDDFEECENQSYVGEFVYRKMKKLGTRIPASRSADYEVEYGLEPPQAVKEIIGSRIIGGRYQYELVMDGCEDEEPLWHDADTLTCIDLIEAFEALQ